MARSAMVTFRVTPSIYQLIEDRRGELDRSEYLRRLIIRDARGTK